MVFGVELRLRLPANEILRLWDSYDSRFDATVCCRDDMRQVEDCDEDVDGMDWSTISTLAAHKSKATFARLKDAREVRENRMVGKISAGRIHHVMRSFSAKFRPENARNYFCT